MFTVFSLTWFFGEIKLQCVCIFRVGVLVLSKSQNELEMFISDISFNSFAPETILNMSKNFYYLVGNYRQFIYIRSCTEMHSRLSLCISQIKTRFTNVFAMVVYIAGWFQ